MKKFLLAILVFSAMAFTTAWAQPTENNKKSAWLADISRFSGAQLACGKSTEDLKFPISKWLFILVVQDLDQLKDVKNNLTQGFLQKKSGAVSCEDAAAGLAKVETEIRSDPQAMLEFVQATSTVLGAAVGCNIPREKTDNVLKDVINFTGLTDVSQDSIIDWKLQGAASISGDLSKCADVNLTLDRLKSYVK